MARQSYDAIVALGGGVTFDGQLSAASEARTLGAVDLYADQAASELIFSGASGGKLMESVAMERLAMELLGIDPSEMPDFMTAEKHSFNTIGNACLTKMHVTDPREWHNLLVVTSDWHVPRATKIFDHVMGPDYEVKVVGVADGHRVPIREKVSTLWNEHLLAGTKPGDAYGIYSELIKLHPRYRSTSLSRVATGNLAKLDLLPPGPWRTQAA